MNKGRGAIVRTLAVIQIFLIPPQFSSSRALALAEGIPPAPNIQEFQFDRGNAFDCGIKFYLHKAGEEIVIFTTDDGEVFAIFSGNEESFQIWIDSNRDGTFDQYFNGRDGFAIVQELYAHPCDILKKPFL